MSLDFARQRFDDFARNLDGAVTQSGRLLLHSVFPDDFEFYMVAFELVQGDKKVTDRFVFPVMPDRMTINDSKITNIKKTAAGVSSFTNNSFVPTTISISGTFGRRLRLLVGNKITRSSKQSFREAGRADFVPNVKTGYGAVKLLQRMFDKSTQLDQNGKPFRVHFYNLAYARNYLIEFITMDITQDPEHNMIWQYSITMRAIAPAETGDFKSQTTQFGQIGIINRLIDTTAQDAKTLL